MALVLPLKKKFDANEKWPIVKEFYEWHYRHSFGGQIPFRFYEQPSDENVEMLYNSMIECTNFLGGYYAQNPDLAEKLRTLRGEIAIK